MAKVDITPLRTKKDQQQSEFTARIYGTQSGAEYSFSLKRNRIEVTQVKGKNNSHAHGKSVDCDWAETLAENEKAQLFALIMDHYRERSLGDNGFRGAAIGVMPQKLADANGVRQTRLFIGTNTMRWASPYFKDCAEQNMVNAATDTFAFEAVKANQKPQEQKLKAIYIMQGINPKERPMSCACGKCTDMLANTMEHKDSPVITIPLLTDSLRKKLQQASDAIVMDSSKKIDAIKPYPDDNKLSVWETTVGHLNHARVIESGAHEGWGTEAVRDQKSAMNALVRRASGKYGLPEQRAVYVKETIDRWRHDRRKENVPLEGPLDYLRFMLGVMRTATRGITRQIRSILDLVSEPAVQSVKNVLEFRKSEASLDCAVKADGSIDLGEVNQFLVTQINDALADRLNSEKVKHLHGFNAKMDWVRQNVRSIRCVAIQLEDNSFRYAVQADTNLDNAMPNAEVVALENAASVLGRHGVKHVWAMEFNPHAIERGELMTSPKEGVERLVKRASKTIDFNYIPLNIGELSHEQACRMMVTMDREMIYPSGHLGYQMGKAEQAARRQAEDRKTMRIV